jgi:phosphoglycolate phosphatase
MFSPASFTGPIEFSSGFAPRREISHVIFDFDGTLSWLRHGWPEIMCRLFREHYPGRSGEPEETIHELLLAEILALNGRQTIYQMERFVEMARERGATVPPPAELLWEYERRLDEVIEQRSALILRGEAGPDEFVVQAARACLEDLQRRGLKLAILSGTIEHRVKQEAELLDLARYFGPHIYGGTADHTQFSKRMVIERLLREEGIHGGQLLSFGDGPVEIVETKRVGGLAIAVASDEEHNGSGSMNPYKRQQLLAAGADVVIPDYQDAPTLLELILN